MNIYWLLALIIGIPLSLILYYAIMRLGFMAYFKSKAEFFFKLNRRTP